MKTAPLTPLFRRYRRAQCWRLPPRAERGQPSTFACETVRAYVSLVGLAQAKAMARASGMTAAQERRARQCLARAD